MLWKLDGDDVGPFPDEPGKEIEDALWGCVYASSTEHVHIRTTTHTCIYKTERTVVEKKSNNVCFVVFKSITSKAITDRDCF